LAAVLQGWGGEHLLASYDIERRPVAIRNVREASGNLRRMLSPRNLKPPPEAFLPGEAGDAPRAEFGRAYTEMMKREWFSIGIHLGYRYEGSPVIVPDGSPEPTDDVTNYEQTARPGHRAPHAWVSPDRSTLDLFGRGFVLLRLGPDAPDAEPWWPAAERVNLPLREVAIASEEILRVHAKPLVLVRPDGHVCWRGDANPADPARIIDIARGAA
jgi:hypothetical protein